jgi:acetolactate decarboxylase
VVFQTSLMSALLDGVYDGELTVGELLTRGDFGLGTFNALDGEMIVLDGTCYRLRSDGSVHPAGSAEQTPFAVITRFVPEVSLPLPDGASREQVQELVESVTPSQNYLYAVRVTGRFESVTTRTVARQNPPYRPLVEVTKGESVQRFEDIDGVLAGFRTPLYERGIGVPGGHLHFVDVDRRRGGHVLDYRAAGGTFEVCIGTDLHLALPLTGAFQGAHLTPEDLGAQITAAEERP